MPVGEYPPFRGYVAAFDVNTGKELWKFWTVPGDPSKGFESKAMEAAAKTWTGEWWKMGGGGIDLGRHGLRSGRESGLRRRR
jgi:quinohemoprotein ethanol dehydrogenase